ncbi:MAG: YbaN family protein [Clostridiales Family XIII bacterium]|jgi:uncharacterized membrane protein YbaN (DUF454 family)|nr:YbaN family protein [Clostridiales Family XIII bacterium]
MIKMLLICFGFFFLAVGAVGIVVPILPTTPFLLLTGLCFAKSSEKFHNWFIQTWLYDKYLRAYMDKRAIPASSKARILITVSILLAVAMYIADNVYARIVMCIVLAGHYYYFLFRVKTAHPRSHAASKDAFPQDVSRSAASAHDELLITASAHDDRLTAASAHDDRLTTASSHDD